MPKKPNDKYSPVMQALLDLQTLGYGKQTVEDLLKLLQKDSKAAKTADALYNRHRYPDTRINWYRVPTYTDCPALYSLPATVQQTFFRLCGAASQEGLVKISARQIAEICGVQDYRSFTNALKTLQQQGFIAAYIPGRGNKQTVYRINPDIIKAGRACSHADKQRFTELNGVDPRKQENQFETAVETLQVEDITHKVGFYRKKELQATAQPTTPTITDIHKHYTKPHKLTQDDASEFPGD